MDVGDAGPARRDRTTLLAVAGGLVAVVLLVVLAVVVFQRADSALRDQARRRVKEDTTLAARLVGEQTLRFSELVLEHAGALSTLAGGPLESLTPAQARVATSELRALDMGTRGLRAAALVSPTGRLLVAYPPNPAFYGRSFAFRDWFRGVTKLRSPYVSRVFRSAAAGHPKTVTVAALVRSATGHRVVGILTVGLQRRTQELAADVTHKEGLALTVTDQAGDVIAATGARGPRIRSARTDPLVRMALAGGSGTQIADGAIEGFAPVHETGWTVTARLPTDVALKDVHDLRTLVIVLTAAIGVLLALLTGGLVLLAQRAQRLRYADVKRSQAMHLHDGVVQQLTLAIGAREAGDAEQADGAILAALAESKRITSELLPDDLQPGDLARPED